MREYNASGDAACALSRDGRMNFIEQNLSAGLFPPCLERSLRGERIPVKTLHPFPELGIIIVTHEDRALFRELLDVFAQLCRVVPTKGRRIELCLRLHIWRIKVVERMGELAIQCPIVAIEEDGVVQHRFEGRDPRWNVEPSMGGGTIGGRERAAPIRLIEPKETH